MAEVDLGKVVGPQGDPGAKGDPGVKGDPGPPGPEGIVDGNSTIDFTVPAAYEEPQSGDAIANLFGRFKRWVLDLQSNIGSLSGLKTPDKSSAVAAINANYDSIAQLEEDVGNPADLTTDAKEVVSAVNELNSALTNRFECGTVTVAGQGSGKWSFVAVSYRYPHKSVPMVVASHGRTNIAPCSCSIRNKTDTGFEIGVYNTAASTDFNWLAIEP